MRRSIRKYFHATDSHPDLHMIYLYIKEKSDKKEKYTRWSNCIHQTTKHGAQNYTEKSMIIASSSA
jgi:hypothetical protein